MHQIVGKTLRFIYQYYPAVEKEDLINYLTVIAYRVAMKYDWEMEEGAFDYTKCLNFTKRSLWNAATLLIKENTGDKYKRIEKVDTDQRLYRVTTISLNTPAEDDWLDIENKLGVPADTTLEVEELLGSIRDKRLHTFLRLEHENVPAFSKYVLKHAGQEENELYTADYAKWRELALSFSGMSTAADRVGAKRYLLRHLDLWDKAKIGDDVNESK